jgi:hypothetical protein
MEIDKKCFDQIVEEGGKAGRNRVRETEIEIKLGQSPFRPLPALLDWIRSVTIIIIIIHYPRCVQASIVLCGRGEDKIPGETSEFQAPAGTMDRR